MIELIETTDVGTVAVLKNDTHASKWIREGRKFFHDETVTKRIVPLIQPGWTCVDVGANLGTFTVAMAKAVGDTGHVLAFEPYLPAFVALTVNVRDLINVEVHNVALAAEAVNYEMMASENAGANHIASVSEVTGGAFRNIRSRRLDVMLLPALNFLKIDVEGFEPHVIAGALETLRLHRPIIFCEINRGALSRYGFTDFDIIAPLLELGYRIEYLDPGHSLRMEQLDVFFFPEELP